MNYPFKGAKNPCRHPGCRQQAEEVEEMNWGEMFFIYGVILKNSVRNYMGGLAVLWTISIAVMEEMRRDFHFH